MMTCHQAFGTEASSWRGSSSDHLPRIGSSSYGDAPGKRALESAALDARQERERDLLRIERDRLVREQRQRPQDQTREDWRNLYPIHRWSSPVFLKPEQN